MFYYNTFLDIVPVTVLLYKTRTVLGTNTIVSVRPSTLQGGVRRKLLRRMWRRALIRTVQPVSRAYEIQTVLGIFCKQFLVLIFQSYEIT